MLVVVWHARVAQSLGEVAGHRALGDAGVTKVKAQNVSMLALVKVRASGAPFPAHSY